MKFLYATCLWKSKTLRYIESKEKSVWLWFMVPHQWIIIIDYGPHQWVIVIDTIASCLLIIIIDYDPHQQFIVVDCLFYFTKFGIICYPNTRKQISFEWFWFWIWLHNDFDMNMRLWWKVWNFVLLYFENFVKLSICYISFKKNNRIFKMKMP